MAATKLLPEFHLYSRGTDWTAFCGMSAESCGVNRSNALCRMYVFHDVVYSTSKKTVQSVFLFVRGEEFLST